MTRQKESAPARFWAKVDRGTRSPDSCWNWLGSTSGGGGVFWYEGRDHSARRIAWLFASGEPPADRLVKPRCRNLMCVRHDHLYLARKWHPAPAMCSDGASPFAAFPMAFGVCEAAL